MTEGRVDRVEEDGTVDCVEDGNGFVVTDAARRVVAGEEARQSGKLV